MENGGISEDDEDDGNVYMHGGSHQEGEHLMMEGPLVREEDDQDSYYNEEMDDIDSAELSDGVRVRGVRG